ncbi:glucosyl transferase [Stygiobacter electus]|uniref:Glucosyl transferase n=1 Tax=Stygiobacter electus TaxID=3032292 RepID=A0AAE3P1K5_9BACT|nr:glucosyl transferase [Stygiobacter electus]MDF1612634.1 glucosyl transferase [Stygiobacter electus]
MKTKQVFILQILAIAAIVTSCNSPTGPVNNSLTLSAEVSCTEAWLSLSANNITLPRNVTITRDGSSLFNFTLTTKDTTLYDSTLAPNKSYTYQALLSPLGGQSDKIVATTLDTTSHNFSWQTFTFGDPGAGSSILYDVAIINENNICAVGEFYKKDSTGQIDPRLYNLLKWNGSKWSTQRVFFTNNRGQTFLAPILSIFVFSQNDILLGMDQIIHWDGNNFKEYEISSTVFHSWINKIWGVSGQDFYIVGNDGNIAHYSSSNWQKLESGITSQIYDIWGIDNSNFGKMIYCEAFDKLLKIDQQNVVSQIQFPYNTYIYSIWFNGKHKFYGSGSGIYENSNNKWKSVDLFRDRAISKIRGTDYNNVFGAGTLGLIVHFNGYSWSVYNDVSQGAYTSLSVKDNIIVAVGFNNGKAIITVGKRN